MTRVWRVTFSVLIILSFASSGALQADGWGNRRPANRREAAYRKETPPASAPLIAADIGELHFKTLRAFVRSIEAGLPGAGSGAFKKPVGDDGQTFSRAVLSLLNGDLTAAVALASSVNYDLVQLTAAKKTYLILIERRTRFRGLGTYIVDPAYKRNLVLEAPHVPSDRFTAEEGRQILQGTSARGLFITGTHRCANSKRSQCGGQARAVCGGGSYRVSDVAHFTDNFFQEAHRATLNLSDPPITMSLHGNGLTELPDVKLSDGTTQEADSNALVNRLNEALENLEVDTGSCNDGSSDNRTFCGETNVQGRLSNKSNDPCKTNASVPTGLFLHVEQHRKIREDPSALIEAITKVIPETR